MSFIRRKWTIVALSAVVVAALGGTALAQSGNLPGVGDDDTPISDPAELERASQAALEHTGGGEVTETEVGDEESYYEVEVTLDDGREVDVQLDEDFQVVGDEVETDDQNDDDTDDNA